MTVYIEYVFLNNLSINYLICYLTLSAVKERASVWRMLAAAAIGGVFAAAYPFMEYYTFVLKLVLSLLMVLIVRKTYAGYKDYFTTLFVFYLISFAFAGAAIAAENFFDLNSGLYPFAVSAGILIAFGGIKYLVSALYKRKKEKNYQYAVEIITKSGGKESAVGYLDSGNKLTDSQGNPVVIISRDLKDRLELSRSGEIAVGTVGGVKILDTVNLDFKIYYGEGLNKLYHTRAAVSENFNSRGYDVILHRDMGGNYEKDIP
jgi:Sporulation factor SpoIIGA.